MGLDHPTGLSVEEVGGVGRVVPVRLPVSPEVEPAVPALLGPIVLAAAQHPEEVMEAPGERMVAGLAVTQVPLGGRLESQTNIQTFIKKVSRPHKIILRPRRIWVLLG